MGNSHRITEGRLLLFASFILVLGFLLVFAAKLPALNSSKSVNLNTDKARRIASALQVDDGTARQIVEYRLAHGDFSSTASVGDVPLLSTSEMAAVRKLSEHSSIDTLSPAQLSARTGIKESAAERLLAVAASHPQKGILKEQSLRRIRLVEESQVRKLDSRLRVRESSAVVLAFWVYSALLIAGFLGFHFLMRKSAPGADPFILPCVLLLSGLGCLILFSIKDPLRDTFVFPMQVQGILIGLAAAAIPLTARFRTFRPWRYTYLFAIAAVFLTLLLAVFGTGPGGVKLKVLGFQPVELTKLCLLFFVASYLADRWELLADRSGRKNRLELPLFKDIGPLAVMYLLSLATFVLVKDLGPMLVLFLMFVTMLYVATGKASFVAAGLGLIGLSGAAAYYLHMGVFSVRVDMWLHPWNNAHPNGMQLGQALWGFGMGGIFGSGLGLGNPGMMSRAGSDLIFASLGEELGLVGSLTILFLFAVLVSRGLRAALHARSDFDRFLAAGITMLIGVQTIVIVFGVLGITPLTGVTLPFMSFGKSSVVASFFLLGLLLSVSSAGNRSVEVRVETKRAVGMLATVTLVLLIGIAGIGRILWIQGVRSDQVAGSTVNTPDADGFARSHVNPRLKGIEAGIHRGSIYDRNGIPLAVSDASDGTRSYPQGTSTSHLVGYLDGRCGGPAGIEKWRNSDLRGFDDYSALLPIYRHGHTPFASKIEGKDVRLTIDSKLQNTVEKALVKFAGAIRDHRTGQRKRKAAAVVLDVYTGEVLAAVSIPDFDPNSLTPESWKLYNRDEKHEAVLVNRALNGIYPPGSTFKLVTASAALQNGIDPTYNCRHQDFGVRWRAYGKRYSRRRITDLEEMRSHGTTDLAKAIRVSCNVYFAHLGIRLGPDLLYRMAQKFHLSQIAPPRKLAEDLPDNAYGQGVIEVTPMEMARVVAAIANGGVMMRPHFVKDVRLHDQVVEEAEPSEMGQPLSRESASKLQKMMADVTSKGTARGVFKGLKTSVAGKTGSAENDHADKMPHSWFVGFAPVHNPRIAFAVVVENGGYGRDAAGPVCREIVKAAF